MNDFNVMIILMAVYISGFVLALVLSYLIV